MSKSSCEICKKETEHKKSPIQLFIGIVLLLALFGIIGALGVGLLWYGLIFLDIYWIKKSWKGKCTQCSSSIN